MPSKIISPDQVEIRHDMDVPTLIEDDAPYDSVVLLFPTDDAQNVTEMSQDELKGIKKLIIIDSTWNQTRHFLIQPNVAKLKKVKI